MRDGRVSEAVATKADTTFTWIDPKVVEAFAWTDPQTGKEVHPEFPLWIAPEGEGAGFLVGELDGYPWNVTSNISGDGVQPENFSLYEKYALHPLRE